MIEPLEGLEFIDTTLRASSAFMDSIPGGLHHLVNTDLPVGVFPDNIFCVYQEMSGLDEVAGGGIRVGVDDLYLIRVIGPASNSAGVKAAANLMDSLIEGASGTTSAGIIYYLIRQRPVILSQTVNDRLALIVGGQYTSFVQGS